MEAQTPSTDPLPAPSQQLAPIPAPGPSLGPGVNLLCSRVDNPSPIAYIKTTMEDITFQLRYLLTDLFIPQLNSKREGGFPLLSLPLIMLR